MLRIIFKDGAEKRYKKHEYTDYWYDRKVFAVIRKKQWVAIYNIDCIEVVECKPKK
jgi:hypothetical protein